MPTFAQKTVYHSKLREASPLGVMFTSEPRPSKHAGKPPYVHFKVQGEDGEYTYNIENDAIEAQLKKAPLNVWCTVTAEGTKDAAVLDLATANGVVTAPAPPTNSNGHAPLPQRDTLAADFWHALEAGAAVVERFQKKHNRPPSDEELKVAAGLFIEYQRTGGQRPFTKDG